MKAILVMEMPENCKECDLCYQRSLCVAVKDDSGCCCGGEIVRAVPGVGIPDWCPLNPMPERKPEVEQGEYGFGDFTLPIGRNFLENIGWNACIDVIEGGKE